MPEIDECKVSELAEAFVIEGAIRAGKRVGDALYLHASAIAVAEPSIRDRVERAAVIVDGQAWNVAKVQGSAVSLLLYEAFDEVAFPALLAAVRINLSDGSVVRTDYRSRPNPPILHRKETFHPFSTTSATAPRPTQFRLRVATSAC